MAPDLKVSGMLRDGRPGDTRPVSRLDDYRRPRDPLTDARIEPVIVDRRKRPRAPGRIDLFRHHPAPWEVDGTDWETWQYLLGDDIVMRRIEREGMNASDARQLGMTLEEVQAFGDRLLVEWRKLKSADSKSAR